MLSSYVGPGYVLRRLMAGECVVDPTMVRQLVQRRRQPNPPDELTPREREVLSLLVEGPSCEHALVRVNVRGDFSQG